LSRKPVLTDAQRDIIAENVDLFPADIKKLPGLAEDNAVTRSIIANYQKKIKADSEPDDGAELVSCLERYIRNHGLPSCYHGKHNVTGFLEYLKGR